MPTVPAYRPADLPLWQKSLVLQLAGLALGQLLGARLAWACGGADAGVYAVWLPGALAMGALLRLRRRLWWAVALTQFGGELLAAVTSGPQDWLATLGFALIHLLEALVCAWLLQYLVGGAYVLQRLREVLLFAVVALLLVPMACAGLATCWYALLGAAAPVPLALHWQIGWLGHALGLGALTPLVLGWLGPHGPVAAWPPAARWPWGIAQAAVLALLWWSLDALEVATAPAALGLQSLVLWAALRQGLFAVAWMACGLLLAALLEGWFAPLVLPALPQLQALLMQQQFLGGPLLSGLVVAGLQAEHASKQRKLGRLRRELHGTRATLEQLQQEFEQRIAQRTAELEHLATVDTLTDAYNRRFLMDRAAIEVAVAQRQAHPVSLIMFDIDHFKRINDSWGHSVGDQVLVALAQAVQRQMRMGDTFARVGGEEFMVLLPQQDGEAALRVAQRLRAQLETLQIQAGPQLQLHITASFGVATLSERVNSVETLCLAADSALYQAKAAGRNCVVADRPTLYSS